MMRIWANNPEWFDEYAERKALEGWFGPDIQKQVEEGELCGYELWALDDGHLAEMALERFCGL